MSETQLASMFIGSADDGDDIDRGRPSDAGNMIHIVNPQTGEILDYITLDNIIDDTHKKSLESYLETYDAIVLGGDGFSYDKHLEKRNHIIIPDEDGTYQEFILFEVDKYRDTEGRKTHFYAHATYLELKKAKIIYPTRREGLTLSQHAGWALNDTGWRVGIVESEGVRTFNIENHTNPYEFLKRIANEFEVEIRFRVEHDGRRITARYVDFLERIGDWKGREVEFGKDLDGIRRIEKQDIVTALLGLGPEREDGTRLEVLVEDEEALQRWGRVDEHGNLHHLIEPYEIQSDRQEMTEEEARQYTRTALNKRINTQVTYETTILDLEEVPGLEHEKIRFGDTIRIKDTYFNPPLYLEARVFEIERSIKNKAKKDIKLGDYTEYTEEEINAIWNQLRNEIRRRLDRMAIVTINSTAGNVFKNAQGETELTARTFVSGTERDEDGTLYDYQWMRFDKDGNHDTDFYAEGKTITVKASDIDEKATYRVLVAYELEVINTAEITISNVFDGEDGEPGPPGEQGPKGDKGEDGQGVDNITIEYYLSDSDSTRTGGTWTETKPTYQPGKYLWIRQKITYKNPTSIEYTTPVLDDSWKAVEIADEAKQEAEEAKQEAQQAQTTADGKNSVFRQSSQPPTTGRKIGDVWFDTSRDNLMHVFNGTQWVEAKWGEQSIVANSITANHIKSLVGLNVNDQFIVDSQGNVKFAGHLEGATGVFSGSISTDKDIDVGNIVRIGSSTGVRELILQESGGGHLFRLSAYSDNNQSHVYFDLGSSNFPAGLSVLRAFNSANNSYDVLLHISYASGIWFRKVTNFLDEIYIHSNGKYGRFGARNASYFHMQTDATNGFYSYNPFNVDSLTSRGNVDVQGELRAEGNLHCKHLSTETIKSLSFDTPLWTGAVYLTDTQTVTPSKPLSSCMTGWILRWQAYNVGQGVEQSNFQYTHIPKVTLQAGGRGHRLVLRRGNTMVTKYVYVYDDYLTGHEGNGQGDDRNLVLTGVFEY